MTKFLAILCLFVALAAATQDCTYGENLRDLYGLTGTGTTPKTYSSLQYCTGLSSGSCCTDTAIASIGTFSDAYTKNITTLVSTRDVYLKNVKDNVLPTLITNIKDFNTAAATFQENIQKMLSSIDVSDMLASDEAELSELEGSDDEGSDDEGSISIDLDPTEMFSGFETFSNMTTIFLAQVDSIKSNYGDYQSARRTCVLAMIDLQNSAMCLSCDPEIETKGFTDYVALLAQVAAAAASGELVEASDEDSDAFDFSDLESIDALFGFNIDSTVCTRLQGNCKPYLALAVQQNMLVEAVLGAQLIGGLTKAINMFNDNDFEGGLAEIMTVMAEANEPADVSNEALMEGVIPAGCDTDGECEWICDGLFTNGIVDSLALIIGGDYGVTLDGEEVSSDEEEEESDDGERRLAAAKRKLGDDANDSNGKWAPAEGSSGVKVTFAVDPANTNTAKKFGSLSLGNVFVGMMVVISSILLF